jgi:2'-5' RNA ligase
MNEPRTSGPFSGEKRRRLFFALWPPEAAQQAIEMTLRTHVAANRGRAIPARNLHVTLVFLGSVPESRLSAVEDCAAAVRGRPFEIVFDRLEVWSRARVLCLTASQVPQTLAQLEEQLRFNLLRERFEIRREAEFRPHVTLVRDVRVRAPQEPIAPVSWRAQEFVLAESRPGLGGSEYTVLRRWALVGNEGG